MKDKVVHKQPKKPLLVGFTKAEHEFVEKMAAKEGITKTAYIRRAINNIKRRA